MTDKFNERIESAAQAITKSVGTPVSIIVHTIAFLCIMGLGFLGVEWNTVLLILTMLLSVEAIYLELLNLFLTNKVAKNQTQ